MAQVRTLTGNYAAGMAAKLARVQAGLFFPMGPSDEVMETFQHLIDTGEATDAKVYQLENEKSCMGAQIAFTRIGVRAMGCVCAEGSLWPASEVRYASGSRLPLVLAMPSRAMGPPTTVNADQDDFMCQTVMGWLQFYCEDGQDVLDTLLQAFRIAEDRRVLLPAFVGYEGWEISHGSYKVVVPDQEMVDKFLPPRQISPDKDYAAVDWKERLSHRRGYPGRYVEYMDKKYVMVKALTDALPVIEEVGREYAETFGSRYVGLIEPYRCDDAEIVFVTMGFMVPTVRFVVDMLRDDGVKAGVVKLRAYRPFPQAALRRALETAKVVVVLERNSLEMVYRDLRSTLYGVPNQPLVMGRALGIGGRRITTYDIAKVAQEAIEALETGKIEREYDWEPIKTLDFDPFEEDVLD